MADFSMKDPISLLLSESESHIAEVILEYAHLAIILTPSKGEADRMGELLAIAVENTILDFWFTEIDHVLGHTMGLLNDKAQQSYEDQQALLREHHGGNISCLPILSDLSELKQIHGKSTFIQGKYSTSGS